MPCLNHLDPYIKKACQQTQWTNTLPLPAMLGRHMQSALLLLLPGGGGTHRRGWGTRYLPSVACTTKSDQSLLTNEYLLHLWGHSCSTKKLIGTLLLGVLCLWAGSAWNGLWSSYLLLSPLISSPLISFNVDLFHAFHVFFGDVSIWIQAWGQKRKA